MTTPSALARVLSVAQAEVRLGVTEKPFGSNNVKYNTAFYGRPVHDQRFAWCAVFQWWCYQRAGIPTSIFPKSARVFTIRDWFAARDRFGRTPRVGSLVIFDFSHIGIVEKVMPHSIQTIEGNTDAAGGRTGGRVMRKVRSRGIQGYCYPAYNRVPGKPTAPKATAPAAKRTQQGPAHRPRSTPMTGLGDADVTKLSRAIGLAVTNALLGAPAGRGHDATTVGQSLYRIQSNLNRDDRQTKRLAKLQVLLHEGRTDEAQAILAVMLTDHPLPEDAPPPP